MKKIQKQTLIITKWLASNEIYEEVILNAHVQVEVQIRTEAKS